jgi:uncharacterized membrane protein
MSAEMGSTRRVHAIDLLRLVMSVQMIQGHTIASLLEPEARSGAGYGAWTFVRGLTAVGFLLAAGASYWLVSEREQGAEQVADGRSRRVRRALLLIGIGFLSRLPIGVLSGDGEHALAALDAFFAIDVLQCIGVSLLMLEGLRRIRAPLGLLAVLVAVPLILLAPFTTGLESERPLRWVLDWVTRRGGSLFPLLPWSGFLLIGVALGPLIAKTRTARGSLGVIALGALIAVVGRSFVELLPDPAPNGFYAWPPFSLLRVGLVLVITGTLGLVSVRVRSLPPWMRILAGQTLVLYLVHLFILHAGGIGLAHSIGATLSWGSSIGVAVILVIVSVGAGLMWPKRGVLLARLRPSPPTVGEPT